MGVWYANTAVHLWRFYFRYRQRDPNRMGSANRQNWLACDRAIREFNEDETRILYDYFMSGFGDYEDMRAVRECAERYRMANTDVWDIIKRANYSVTVERGLMERREIDAKNTDHGPGKAGREDIQGIPGKHPEPEHSGRV